MPRAVSAALQTELSKTITRLGYLLSFSTTPPLRLCNVGAVEWNGLIFIEYDFTLEGAGYDVNGSNPCTLRIQNLDDAVAALFSLADFSAVTCDVWQIAPAAVATADAARLGRYALGECEIGVDWMRLQLEPENALAAFSPRRRVDPSYGFYHALPEGSKIAWENEVYIVGGDRG